MLVTEFLDSQIFEEFCITTSQTTRNSIGLRIMELTVREIFEFKLMQTDPNPANFQYCPRTDKLHLLDFGATRKYSDEFIEKYREAVIAGINKDSDKALENLKILGFLVGDENKELLDARIYFCCWRTFCNTRL